VDAAQDTVERTVAVFADVIDQLARIDLGRLGIQVLPAGVRGQVAANLLDVDESSDHVGGALAARDSSMRRRARGCRMMAIQSAALPSEP